MECQQTAALQTVAPQGIPIANRGLGSHETQRRQPPAFQKHETAELLPSQTIGSAQALPDHDAKGLDVLKQRQGTAAA